MSLLLPIVGMHFRPPAKEVIALLPNKTELLLVAEPSNAYDPLAIKVTIHVDQLIDILGEDHALFDAIETDDDGEHHLGYICKVIPKKITPGNYATNAEIYENLDGNDVCELRFTSNGEPLAFYKLESE